MVLFFHCRLNLNSQSSTFKKKKKACRWRARPARACKEEKKRERERREKKVKLSWPVLQTLLCLHWKIPMNRRLLLPPRALWGCKSLIHISQKSVQARGTGGACMGTHTIGKMSPERTAPGSRLLQARFSQAMLLFNNSPMGTCCCSPHAIILCTGSEKGCKQRADSVIKSRCA